MSLVVVGTVAFDAIETPFGKSDKIIGGAATYIGLSASYFTDKVQLVSVVGDDFPKEKIELMQQKSIDTEGLQIKQGEKSFFWSGKYHYDMNTRDTLITELNVLADFNPIIPASYQNCDYLMLGNLTPSVQMQVIENITNRPKLVVLDTMNFWMETAMSDLKEVMKKVDVICINDEEARQLSGEYALIRAARRITEMGPQYVIIKKGEHGALLYHEDELFYAPALPLENVFDPTGAGDTFAGGFVGYLAGQEHITFENMKRAVIYGSAMASFCVEKFGTQNLENISRSQIDERIQQFVDLVQVELELV